MSPLKRSNNIAARMGRWSASHWKTAVFGWLVFVVAALFVGNFVGTKNIETADANVGQAHKADQILKKAFPQVDPQTELVLVQSSSKTVRDSSFRATIKDVESTIAGNPAIKNVRSPLDPANADQVSKDGRSAMVLWDMKGTYENAKPKIDGIVSAVGKAADRHPEFYVEEAGSVSSGKALDKMFSDQLKLAGERSIPITIVVLLLVFGALVAVGVPLLLALSGVMATIGLVALPSHIVPMDQNVSAVILLVGLAVGVDYSLFYLKREREERAAGRSPRAALEAAAATSGRSVLISGITVMVAMAGMMFSGDKSYLGFGVATMMVVGIAMLGSLTVLPALLSRLGDKIEKGKIPYLHRLRRGNGENRFWKAILTPVLRRPALAAAISGGVLLVLAAPVLQLHTAQSGLDAMPNSAPTVGTMKKIEKAFSNGDLSPAIVAVAANTDSSATRQAISELKSQAIAYRADARPDRRRDQSVPLRRAGDDPARRQGHGRRLERSARHAAEQGPPRHGRQGLRRDLRGHRPDGAVGGRERTAEAEGTDRLRFRPGLRVHPAAGLVQVDRDRSEGHRAQRALRRRGVWRARRPVPVGLGRELPRLPVERRHRVVAADLHVRDPVRPLDGLSRVHPEPGAGGLRPRA